MYQLNPFYHFHDWTVLPGSIRTDFHFELNQQVLVPKSYEAGNLKAARKLQVRIEEKFTFPMACVVFGLIGSSLGSRPGSRTSRSQGFGISILLILGYYALSVSFSSLGVKGVLPALLAAWLPVLISLGAGTLLLRQASR